MNFEVVERQGDYTLAEYAIFAVASNGERAFVAYFQTEVAAEELAAILNHSALLLTWHKHPETMGR